MTDGSSDFSFITVRLQLDSNIKNYKLYLIKSNVTLIFFNENI